MIDKTCMHSLSYETFKECVAVLIGLYKKNGAVLCVGIDFYLIWSLDYLEGVPQEQNF